MKNLSYKWFPQNYISDPRVLMMTCCERGVYRDLIDLAYMENNQIKFTVIELAKYCNAPDEIVDKVLAMKGEHTGEFWRIPSVQSRIDAINKYRENGSKGGRPKNQTETKPLTKPETHKDKDKVKSKVKSKIKPKTAREIIHPWQHPDFPKHWEMYLEYRKREHGFEFKTELSEQAALNKLAELSDGHLRVAVKIINQTFANGWKGFFKLDSDGKRNSKIGTEQKLDDNARFKKMLIDNSKNVQ